MTNAVPAEPKRVERERNTQECFHMLVKAPVGRAVAMGGCDTAVDDSLTARQCGETREKWWRSSGGHSLQLSDK
jgi:hypothetical protein